MPRRRSAATSSGRRSAGRGASSGSRAGMTWARVTSPGGRAVSSGGTRDMTSGPMLLERAFVEQAFGRAQRADLPARAGGLLPSSGWAGARQRAAVSPWAKAVSGLLSTVGRAVRPAPRRREAQREAGAGGHRDRQGPLGRLQASHGRDRPQTAQGGGPRRAIAWTELPTCAKVRLNGDSRDGSQPRRNAGRGREPATSGAQSRISGSAGGPGGLARGRVARHPVSHGPRPYAAATRRTGWHQPLSDLTDRERPPRDEPRLAAPDRSCAGPEAAHRL